MTKDEIIEKIKKGKPYKEPQIKTEVKRSCNNCQDYIVCYGLNEAKNPEKGKTCPDWQIDFETYQKMIEEGK